MVSTGEAVLYAGGGLVASEALGITNFSGDGGMSPEALLAITQGNQPISGGGIDGGALAAIMSNIQGQTQQLPDSGMDMGDMAGLTALMENVGGGLDMGAVSRMIDNATMSAGDIRSIVENAVPDVPGTGGTNGSDDRTENTGPSDRDIRTRNRDPLSNPKPGIQLGDAAKGVYDLAGVPGATVEGTGDTLGGILDFSHKSGRTTGAAIDLLYSGETDTSGTFNDRGKVELFGGYGAADLGSATGDLFADPMNVITSGGQSAYNKDEKTGAAGGAYRTTADIGSATIGDPNKLGDPNAGGLFGLSAQAGQATGNFLRDINPF